MEAWYGIGYPRSANSWVRYIIRDCLGNPEIGVHSIDHHDQFYVKRHHLDASLARGRSMLLLVRNYKEVIIRHNLDQTEDQDYNFYNSLEKMPVNWTQPAVSYIHPIYVYDNWGQDKHIVYYEDLMSKPAETIQDMAERMGFCANNFLENYQYHRDRSVSAYNTQEPSGSWTKAGSVFSYNKQITHTQKEAWDNHLETKFPKLFDRYLKRYAE